jgi:hypothetical protein
MGSFQVQHIFMRHNKEHEPQWTHFTSEEVEAAHHEYEENGLEPSELVVSLRDRGWGCTHCRDLETERGPFCLEKAEEHCIEE